MGQDKGGETLRDLGHQRMLVPHALGYPEQWLSLSWPTPQRLQKFMFLTKEAFKSSVGFSRGD